MPQLDPRVANISQNFFLKNEYRFFLNALNFFLKTVQNTFSIIFIFRARVNFLPPPLEMTAAALPLGLQIRIAEK